MRIPDLKLSLPIPTQPNREQLLQSLKPGQVLQARALSENLNGSIQLQIGVNKLIAQTQLLVKPGQPLTLQVDKTGLLPELKLISLPSLQQQQANALKQILPRQQPLPPLFENLLGLAKASGAGTAPAEVKQSIQTLLSRILPAEHPDFRQQLRDALLNSGLLTEAHLLKQKTNSGDFKLNLLRLLGLIQSLSQVQPGAKSPVPAKQTQSGPASPPATDSLPPKPLVDLLKQLDGALARIQTNQLASLAQEDNSRQIWQFELPIRQQEHIDLFQMLVRREPASSPEAETEIWSLTLKMNLAPLGPMRVQLRLQGEKISTSIWVQENSTTDLVEKNLTSLRQAFEKAGLEVSKLEAYQGIVENKEDLALGLSLLSEKA